MGIRKSQQSKNTASGVTMTIMRVQKKRFGFLAFVVVVFLAQGALASTYYVSTTGSDSTPGTCTSASPCYTISKALSLMASGDTLIVKNGTYIDRSGMLINDRSANIPSGPAGGFTTIKAETPYGVRIKWTGGLDYYDAPVLISRANRVHVDGFIFEFSGSNLAEPSYMVEFDTTYNKATRCIAKRSHVDAYGGWFASDGNYNLFEDCAGVGAARYGFYVGGPDSSTKYNIFRRCVGRVDFANTDQPKGTFCIYGNNSTTAVQYHLFQNCISIDGHRPSGDEEKYGAWYHPKNANQIVLQGSIVLNESTGHAGMFLQEWGQNISITHSVIYNLANSASWAVGLRANTGSYLSASYLTLGGTLPGGAYYGGTAATNSRTGGTMTNLLDNTPGAVIIKRYGTDGTFYGESGYNTLTSSNLWPFPGEDAIKMVFAEQLSTPSGYTPANNVSARGFAAGTSMDGSPQTFTKYIWEYLGNRIPATVYPSGPSPAIPSGFKIVQ
jgi:hypothetical protein